MMLTYTVNCGLPLIVFRQITLLFLSLSTEHVVFCVCYVSLQFLD